MASDLLEEKKSLKIWLSFLRRRNVHVNRRVLHGWTPLMATVCPGQIGSIEFVRLLLACGADVSLTKEHGQQALHLALGESAPSQVVPKFNDNTKGFNPDRHDAVVGVITCLVKAGADIFTLDNEGRTPLDFAILAENFSPWTDALEHCGLSVRDTMEESRRRLYQWKADRHRLHGAKRTAVDAEILQTPSTEGLRKRRRELH
jgi:ankyrin repeat protein